MSTSDYKWLRASLQVTTNDCEWLRVRLRVSTSQTTSDYESGYEWLRVITSDYKWLPVNSETLLDLEWLVIIAGKKLVQIINCLITFCKFIINIISTIFVLPVNAAWPSYLHLIKYEWLMLKLWLNHREIFRFGLFIWTNNSRHETEFWKGLLLKGFTKKIAIFWVLGEI